MPKRCIEKFKSPEKVHLLKPCGPGKQPSGSSSTFTHAACKLLVMDRGVEDHEHEGSLAVKMPDRSSEKEKLKALYREAAGGTIINSGRQYFYKTTDCKTVYLLYFRDSQECKYFKDWFPSSA